MTIEDFLLFFNNNSFVNEEDFVEKFQTKFPRTICKNILIDFYRNKDINIVKCPRESCQNILKYKHKYCSNYCCREDFKERNIVHENWKTTREIRCKNMKISNSKRTKDFYHKRKEKYEQTCIKKFGVSSNVKLQSTRENLSKKALERWENKTEEEKQDFATLMKKVNTGRPSINGYNTWSREKQIMSNIKSHITKKKNGSYGKSKEEDDVYKILCEKFSSEDIERQYKDKRYGFDGDFFACDFYIKSKDLFIEYQGYWTHGNYNSYLYGPFDKNNPKHIELYNKWKQKNTKYYNIAIHVWTVTDPLKRKVAAENNLNWKEFWTVDEVKEWVAHIVNQRM